MRARHRSIAAVLAIAGCAGERPPAEPNEPRAPLATRLPGPGPQARRRGYDVVAENDGCVRCHADIAAEWQLSQHREAWDDPVFLSAYVLEPIPFCRHCHAPEVDETRIDPDPSRHIGVGCVTCHVTGDEIVGTRARSASGEAHRVIAEPRLATVAWCKSCHQFAFPEPQDAAMQDTLREHRESVHRDRSCQDCHMPVVPGAPPHRSHRFRVQGDDALLQSALAVEARRSGDRSIALSLRVTGAGHAVPTGDMFRRLELRAQSGAQRATPVVLAREFRRHDTPHGAERLQVGDARVPASGAARHAELVFLEPPLAPIRWEVVYQRMGPHEAMLFGVDVPSEETLLASGMLAAPREEPPHE